MENKLPFTRMGAHGVTQLDTARASSRAAFTHRDSRAGDPDLHSHVPISNKVRARGHDGIYRWLAIDGRPLFKGTVAASEFYNSRIETLNIEHAGLRMADHAPAKRGNAFGPRHRRYSPGHLTVR
ncbi:relaxase domain-containing protein [Mycobacterium sp. SMC-18]|uniref:relaxase domain-containing protein n=1 Tax=Mycobacterium sp. SMC-18 TaxID=3381629 RepID=UPI00387702A1